MLSFLCRFTLWRFTKQNDVSGCLSCLWRFHSYLKNGTAGTCMWPLEFEACLRDAVQSQLHS